MLHARLFLSLALCAALVSSGTAQKRPQPRIGVRYPALALPSLSDGNRLSLTSFRGKKVLLIEFASW